MIYTRIGETFEATADGLGTGLVGTLGVRVVDGIGNTVTARATSGIVESPAGSGVYTATLTAPADAGTFSVVFDTGGAEPGYATEGLVVNGAVSESHRDLAMRPTVAEVGALIRVRTYADGQYLGTFTDATRPTDDQVETYIGFAMDEIMLRMPTA